MSGSTEQAGKSSPLPLEYEMPRTQQANWSLTEELASIGAFIRRVVFAVGVGLIMAGIGYWLSSRTYDLPEFLGWGGALVALSVPLPWRPRS